MQHFMNISSGHSYTGKSTNKRVLQITNITLFRHGKLIEEDLWIQSGKVIDPQKRFWEAQHAGGFSADQVLDGRGCIVCAGFIDIQFNGAYGVDFSNAENCTKDKITYVSQRLLQTGVTSYVPTIVSSSPDTYERVLPLFKATPASVMYGAEILGVHLEGPFLSKDKKGAHDEQVLRHPTDTEESLKGVYGDLSQVRIVTLAPELKGAIETTKALTKRGIRVSLGHTNCSIAQAERAIDEGGANLVTHLFNAMQSFHHRDPGLIGLLGSRRKSVYYSIIADGIHCHPYAISLAHAARPDQLLLITDCMAAGGLCAGRHQLGNMEVDIENNKATLADAKHTLAGSIVFMDSCVRYVKNKCHFTTEQALRAATHTPAQALGIRDRKGGLEFGLDADFVFLDEALNVKATFVGGQIGWSETRFLRTMDGCRRGTGSER